jgi:endogenous inhibitor of DNA gyrase (YacG/DUF329 family)
MVRKRAIHLRCPACKNPVQAKNPDFPFCSERCRLIDLGKWASGGYVISTPVPDISDSVPDSPPKGSDED